MRKIRVEYFKDKCIGQGNCESISPEHFKLIGSKAILKDSKKLSDDVYCIELDCDENAERSLIEAGKACPVNAIKVVDLDANKELVSVSVKQEDVREIKAEYDDSKEFVLDSAGYFLIRVDRKNKNIEVAFCNERNKVTLKVTGKKPIDIYQTIINKENLPIRKDHAAYLGRELEKAFLALNFDLEYVQDDELNINKRI